MTKSEQLQKFAEAHGIEIIELGLATALLDIVGLPVLSVPRKGANGKFLPRNGRKWVNPTNKTWYKKRHDLKAHYKEILKESLDK